MDNYQTGNTSIRELNREHFHYYSFWVDFPTVNLPDHVHEINLPHHYHSFSVSPHSHSFSVSDHSHSLSIQPHTHPITPGIYRFGSPASFQIKVNSGVPITVNNREYEVDITKMLIKDGKIPRGAWHKLLITPNDLAYISISMCVQGFVQSRGDTAV